jgi:hypothetical protein
MIEDFTLQNGKKLFSGENSAVKFCRKFAGSDGR